MIKVLVVDDEFLVREFLSDILLATEKYQVISADNGQTALDLCRQDAGIGLIVSDMNMPVKDGLSMIKDLRGAGMDMPIVVMSGNNEIAIAIAALNSGANDYLIKDENIQDTVVLAVEKALEKKRIEDDNRQLQELQKRFLVELDGMVHELETVVERMTVLGTALSSERHSNRLAEVIISHAVHLSGADYGLLWMMEKDKLVCTGLQALSLGVSKYNAEGIGMENLAVSQLHPVALAALNKQPAQVPDIAEQPGIDMTLVRRLDAAAGLNGRSMYLVPMLHHGHDLMGVIQLVNTLDADTGRIRQINLKRKGILESLALQAALAIRNQKLFHEMENLFEAVVQVMASAIDEKSPVTKGHISRVAQIAVELAQEVNAANEGAFVETRFTEDELDEIRIAALLHDVGKITTPEHILEKGTKLEKLLDRLELIEERFRYVGAALTAQCMAEKIRLMEEGAPEAAVAGLDEKLRQQLRELQDDIGIIRAANNPEEFMSDEKLARLQQVYAKRISLNGDETRLLTDDEFTNLSIRRGSITPAELAIMRNHVEVTIRLLNQIPFTEKLKNVPIYAGGHHEKLNGQGYPQKLAESQLPLQTRIVAIADLFEALTASDRPYKKSMPLAKAMSIMESAVENEEIDRNLFELFKKQKLHERLSGRGQHP